MEGGGLRYIMRHCELLGESAGGIEEELFCACVMVDGDESEGSQLCDGGMFGGEESDDSVSESGESEAIASSLCGESGEEVGVSRIVVWLGREGVEIAQISQSEVESLAGNRMDGARGIANECESGSCEVSRAREGERPALDLPLDLAVSESFVDERVEDFREEGIWIFCDGIGKRVVEAPDEGGFLSLQGQEGEGSFAEEEFEGDIFVWFFVDDGTDEGGLWVLVLAHFDIGELSHCGFCAVGGDDEVSLDCES